MTPCMPRREEVASFSPVQMLFFSALFQSSQKVEKKTQTTTACLYLLLEVKIMATLDKE